jgi:molybdenum cofactor cytidylyltransferase
MRSTDWDCVIPAAGASRRMGSPKQLLPLGGGTLLTTVISRTVPHCARCIVVTGAQRERVRRVIPGDTAEIIEVHNPDHPRGMITSIMVGARHVRTAWFFVVPADMPRLPACAFELLAGAARRDAAATGDAAARRDAAADPGSSRRLPGDDGPAHGQGAWADLPAAYFPVMAGRRGHPVLVSSRVIPVLLGSGGEYPSMGAFLRRYPAVEVPVEDEGIFLDVDTPADLAAMRDPSTDGSAR